MKPYFQTGTNIFRFFADSSEVLKYYVVIENKVNFGQFSTSLRRLCDFRYLPQFLTKLSRNFRSIFDVAVSSKFIRHF